MVEHMKKYLFPPVFEDEETTRLAGLLYVLLWTILMFMVLYAVVALFEYEQTFLLVLNVLVMIPFWLLSYAFLQQGRVKIATTIFLAAMWIIVTTLALLSGGVSSTATITFIPIPLAAGLLLGWRIGLVFFSLSVLAELGMLFAELSHILPAPVFQPTPVARGIGLIVNLVLTIILTRLATNSIMQVLKRARRNEQALEQSNRKLQRYTRELRCQENALRESKELFQSLIETLPQNVFAKDVEGRFIFANQRYCALEDRPLSELLGKTDFDLHPHELAQKYRDDDRRVIETGSILDIEEVHQPLDGEKTYVQVIKTPIYHSDGQVIGVMGTFWDITGRRQMEESLRQARKDWEEIFQAIGHPTLILDADYTVLEANRAALDATGLNKNEMKNQKCFDIFHRASQNPERCPLERVIHSEQFETVEMEMEALGGVYLVSCTPVLNEEGNLQKIIHIATDITARKQAEEEIQRLNAELEQRVTQRTADLEAVNRELKSFAYVVSHDLKAPLRGISRLAHWLVQDNPDLFDEKAREMAALLIGRVKRMDHLIEGILEYSRIGRINGQDERIDTDRLVRAIIEILAPPETIRIRIKQALPEVYGDKIRMTQIFQNLLDNAIKFMDKPQGEITIRCADDGSHWIFMVSDNGPGIDQRYQERIFQIFQTLHPRDEFESTGVGLALAKKIVELYGGQIWVESTPGKGSTFCFTLPKI